MAVFRKGAEFAKELLEDNQRLREQIQSIERRQQEASVDSGVPPGPTGTSSLSEADQSLA